MKRKENLEYKPRGIDQKTTEIKVRRNVNEYGEYRGKIERSLQLRSLLEVKFIKRKENLEYKPRGIDQKRTEIKVRRNVNWYREYRGNRENREIVALEVPTRDEVHERLVNVVDRYSNQRGRETRNRVTSPVRQIQENNNSRNAESRKFNEYKRNRSSVNKQGDSRRIYRNWRDPEGQNSNYSRMYGHYRPEYSNTSNGTGNNG